MTDLQPDATHVRVSAKLLDTLAGLIKAPANAKPDYVLTKAAVLVGAAVAEINKKFAEMHALIATDVSTAELWAELDRQGEVSAGELTRLFGRALALATKHAGEANRLARELALLSRGAT